MSKRALKRQLREGAFDAGQFEGDDKIRRLPVDRGWSPLAHHNDDREQSYVKTIKAKSPGQQQLIEAIDAKNLVMALGPAGTGKTYLAIAKAVEALERAAVGRIVALVAAGGRNRRKHRPARRRRGQARALPAPALRRAVRPAVAEAGQGADGGRPSRSPRSASCAAARWNNAFRGDR